MTSVGSKLPRGVVLVGSIRGQGDLRIAGEVEGPIEIDGLLVIDPSGVVRGDVRARSITVAGQLEGNATAVELVRLEPGAKMIGDARAERVSAAAGALLRGRIRTSQERAQLERMRRTTGGTLLAPYSSSGMIAAPESSAGMVRAPSSAGGIASPVHPAASPARRRDSEPLPPLAEVVRDEPGIEPVRARGIVQRYPEAERGEPPRAEPPRVGPPPREPQRVEPQRVEPPRVESQRVEPQPPPSPGLVAHEDADRPPPPVMPSLGRRRATRRNVEAPS